MNKQEAIDQLKSLKDRFEHYIDLSEDNKKILEADIEAIDLILEAVNNKGLAYEKLSEENSNLKHENDHLYLNNQSQKQDIKRLNHLVYMYELIIRKMCEDGSDN